MDSQILTQTIDTYRIQSFIRANCGFHPSRPRAEGWTRVEFWKWAKEGTFRQLEIAAILDCTFEEAKDVDKRFPFDLARHMTRPEKIVEIPSDMLGSFAAMEAQYEAATRNDVEAEVWEALPESEREPYRKILDGFSEKFDPNP